MGQRQAKAIRKNMMNVKLPKVDQEQFTKARSNITRKFKDQTTSQFNMITRLGKPLLESTDTYEESNKENQESQQETTEDSQEQTTQTV